MSYWTLIKVQGNMFAPMDEQTEERAKKVKIGGVIHGDFKQMRNYKFHKKLFALLNFGFERWEPGEINCQYGKPEKNFNRFRKDITILAGFFDVVIRLDGTTRIEAKSISFANMDNEEFEHVYNGVLNVLLKKIPAMVKMSAEEVNKIVDQLIAFG